MDTERKSAIPSKKTQFETVREYLSGFSEQIDRLYQLELTKLQSDSLGALGKPYNLEGLSSLEEDVNNVNYRLAKKSIEDKYNKLRSANKDMIENVGKLNVLEQKIQSYDGAALTLSRRSSEIKGKAEQLRRVAGETREYISGKEEEFKKVVGELAHQREQIRQNSQRLNEFKRKVLEDAKKEIGGHVREIFENAAKIASEMTPEGIRNALRSDDTKVVARINEYFGRIGSEMFNDEGYEIVFEEIEQAKPSRGDQIMSSLDSIMVTLMQSPDSDPLDIEPIDLVEIEQKPLDQPIPPMAPPVSQ